MHKPLFSIFVFLIILSLVSVTIPSVYATVTISWYNTCENISDWTLTGGCTSSLNPSTKAEGSASILLQTPSDGTTYGYAILNNTISSGMTSGWLGFYFRPISTSSLGSGIIGYFEDSTTGYYAYAYASVNSGHYYFAFAYSLYGHSGSDSPNNCEILVNTWYWIEIKDDINDTVALYVDGVSYCSSGGLGDIFTPNLFKSGMYENYGACEWLIDYVRTANTEEYPPTFPTFSIYNLDYTYTFIPLPESLTGYGTFIVLNQSLTYYYNATVELNSTLVNGTYNVYSTGITALWPQTLYLSSSLVASGNISNGEMQFYFNPRSSPIRDDFYEKISILLNIDTVYDTFNETHFIVWKTTLPYVSPFYTPPEDYSLSTNLISWLEIFMIIFVPIMILGFIFKKTGLLIGMIYSVGIGVITSLVPTWFIVVIVVGIALVGYDMLKSSGG